MFPWINFLTYAVITAVTPGPNNLMSLSNASRLGFRKTLPFNFGVWVGFTILMLLCTLLSNTLHSILPIIKTPMLLIGAVYMLYLAWKTFKSTSELSEKSVTASFYSGMLLQFVNPKSYIYGIVSMEAYILPFYQGRLPQLILFAVLLASVGFLFTLCWSLFGSAFRVLFSKHAKLTNSIMALLLVYCAVSLFF